MSKDMLNEILKAAESYKNSPPLLAKYFYLPSVEKKKSSHCTSYHRIASAPKPKKK